MLAQVRMTLEGEVLISRMLDGLESRATDMGPVWPTVLAAFQKIVGRAFDTEGASTGAPWPALARSTQRERQRQGYPPAHPILQRSKKLQRALVLGEGAYATMQPTRLMYQVSEQEVPYFKYHQSNKPRTRLPRRAPVLLTGDDRNTLMQPIRLWLTGYDPNAPQRRAIG